MYTIAYITCQIPLCLPLCTHSLLMMYTGVYMPLSDTKLRSIEGKPYDGKPELADRDGLSVRVTRNGTVSWQYRFRWERKPARLTIGRYPDIKVKDARELIPEIRNLLTQGIDPRVSWKPGKGDQAVITVEDCVKEFIAKRLPKLKEKSQTHYKSVLNKYYRPAFPNQDIHSITLDEWLDFYDDLSDANPKLAANVLKEGKTLFNWCMRRRMITPPHMMTLRTEDVGIPPETGERVLTLRECGEIWRAADRSRAAASTSLCIKLCMLFACRQGEIRGAHRDHFDMEEMVWTVPKELSKTNKPIRRPITAETEKLIRQAWAFYGEDGYLLPAEQDNNKMPSASTINKLLRAIRKRLGEERKVIDHWRCHDFRRTLSTRLSEDGIMPHVTEKMLGHVLKGIMAVYNKHDWLDDQRKAYELWGEKILESVQA